MKVINLAGQPSAGKSTTAAGLFYLMKHAGLNVELIDEYAKQMTWEKRFGTIADQLYILAKQNSKLERLRGQVDYVISDSPLFLGRIYNQSNRREVLARRPDLPGAAPQHARRLGPAGAGARAHDRAEL